MKIKLRCIKDCSFQDFSTKKGDSVRASMWDGDRGIRFERSGKMWSNPYLISLVEKYFVSDFDDEEWERRVFKDG